MADGETNDMPESVDELRARLKSMKELMAERRAYGAKNNADLFKPRSALANAGIIDASFLSFVFGSALVVILSVSVYAFYHLYHAVLMKFPSRHTEL